MKAQKVLKRGAGWVLVCRESASEYERSILGHASSPRAVHEVVRDRILREQVEVIYAIALDGRNRVLAMCEVARGGLSSCSVSAREILRPMIVIGARSFVLVHNHPSGDPTPSREDIEMTRAVLEASLVVGVPLFDHVIIATWDRYFSMLDHSVGGLGS